MAQPARILDATGKPYRADEASRPLPPVRREPPQLVSGRFTKKSDFEAVVQSHDLGYFYYSSWLASQMLTDSRVASAMEVRCDALIGKKIVWTPGKLNDKGRRAARDIEEEWPLIAPPTARAQLHRWGLIQGIKVAQRHWYIRSNGRAIPRIEPYSTQWVNWDWAMWAYRVWTWMDGWRLVPSPSLIAPGEEWKPSIEAATPFYKSDDPRAWTVYEPFGVHSWRDEQNLIHSLWRPYFGHALADNDANRVCERQGRGNLVLKYPKTTDTTSRDAYIDKLLNVGAEGIYPLEQYGRNTEEDTANYELEPLEWPANGWEIVKGVLGINADEIAIRILGHATMQQTNGASVGASARTGYQVSADKAIGDTQRETGWAYPLLRDWAAANYGDPDCAPIPGYVVDEPMANVQAAQTAAQVAVALPVLAHYGADTVELMRRFNFPLVDNPPQNPGPPPATKPVAASAEERP